MLRTIAAAVCVLVSAAPAQEVRLDPAAIDALFTEWDRTDSPGCALGVVLDGELVYARGYGMANLDYGIANGPDTVFRIGSTSKQVTAMCIGLLALDGALSLDDDVRRFVPELPDHGERITIRHLVHHTSGLRDYLTLMVLAGRRSDDWYTTEEALEALYRQRATNFAPGAEYLYSNTGYLLLGLIVQRASGESLREFAEERIFAPLGMRHTHYHDDHTEIVRNRATGYSPRGAREGLRIDVTTLDMVGDGGVFTTVEDWLLWDRNSYERTVGGDELHDLLRTTGALNDGTALDYAFGLRITTYRGLPVEAHGGAFVGFRADCVRFPEQRFSVICFANLGSFDPSAKCREVADLCLAELFPEPRPERGSGPRRGRADEEPAEVELTAEQRAALAGEYTSHELLDVVYRIREEGDRLLLKLGPNEEAEVTVHAPDELGVWGMALRFDGAGGFELDAGRVRGIRFQRVGVAPGGDSDERRADLLIRGGTLLDGTGTPGALADVAVVGGRIAAVGDLAGWSAARTVDATGLVVAPGFIDLHTHVDGAFEDPSAAGIVNYLLQGVTTVRPGADGSSDHRVLDRKRRWEANGMGPNALLTVGINDIRREALGGDMLRAATPEEVEAMRAMVRAGMEEGAFGVSIGLEYDGLNVHMSTEEVIAVTEPAAEFDGFYISHMRDEASRLVEAVEEVVRIAEQAGVRGVVTHMKSAGRDNWGRMADAVAAIDAARARGVPVFGDQYPFDQGAPIDFVTELIDVPRDMQALHGLHRAWRRSGDPPPAHGPAWDEYVRALQAALRDSQARERMRASTYEQRDADPSPAARWGWQDFRIKVAPGHPELVDVNLGDLVEQSGRDGFDIVADFVLAEPGALFASASMSQEDVRTAMTRPWVAISSDGAAFAPAAPGSPAVRGHPRSFASQAILLRRYVREEGVLTLEEAVRKLTSLPADIVGLKDRGRVAEGLAADLVVFDPATVQDHATWDDAHRPATGIVLVLVSGVPAVEGGRITGARAGLLLLRR